MFTERMARYALNKAGYALRKSRKQFSADNLGGYMIIDLKYNCAVCGPRYELDLDDVQEWLKGNA